MAFEYVRSTITQYRAGTKNDPYVDITETREIINGQVLMNEIPEELSKVRITGMYEVPSSNKKELAINEYRVDYVEGIISFHSSLNGTNKTFSYKGRGNHFVSASRIWTKEQNGNVIETLNELVEAGQIAIGDMEDLKDLIVDAQAATNAANAAATDAANKATLANTNANYAKTQGDAAQSATNAANAAKLAAETATTNAIKATNDANNAATAANTKAALADSRATEAKTQADYAKSEGDKAKTATGEATTAAASAQTATQESKTATDAAKSATTDANVAAQLANQKAGLAQTAATDANTATGQANQAADLANAAAASANEKAVLANSVATSLVHKGPYDNNIDYVVRNIVYYKGSTYMSIVNSKGILPTNTAYWARINTMVWKGTYNSSTIYNFGDVVASPDNYTVYLSIKDGSTGNLLTDPMSWTPLVDIRNLSTQAENLISGLSQALQDVETATLEAMEATDAATTQANYAKSEGDYAKTQGDAASFVAQSMKNMGPYSETTQYVPLNIVTYQGSVYQNIQSSTGIVPTNSTYWMLLLTIANSVTWDNISGKPTNLETVEGAQAKADLAEQNAKTYTDQALAEFEPPNTDPIIIDLPVIPDEYGVIADDTTDNTAGLQRYIDDCIAKNESEIWIPAAEKPYRISGTLTIGSNVNLVGEGDKSWIYSTINDKAPIKFLNATNSSIRNLRVSSLADVRTSSQQGAITVQNSTNILIQNVLVSESSATGFFITGSNRVRVLGNRVSSTLADGIHTTGKSKDVVVAHNQCINTGDDAISVVSYQSQSERCENVVISDNTVRDGKARGITNVGGRSVKISNNIIDGTASRGILVHRDGNVAYNTFAPIDTTVLNNTIKRAGAIIPNVGTQNGIEVGESEDTKIIGNSVDGSLHRGVAILDAAKRVQLDDNDSNNNSIAGYLLQGTGIQGGVNRAYNNGEQGVLILNLTYSTFESFIVYDSANLVSSKNNIHIENSNNLILGDMISLDNRSTQKINRAVEIINSSYIKHGKVILNKGSRPVYSGTCTHIEAYPFIVTTAPNASTFNIFEIGQELICSADNRTYVWNGTAWVQSAVKADVDSIAQKVYVGTTAPTNPPINSVWIDIS